MEGHRGPQPRDGRSDEAAHRKPCRGTGTASGEVQRELQQQRIALDRWAGRLGEVGRALQTGSFINTMWGGEGSMLGYLEMGLIRLLLIWPLKAVAPCAYGFLLWRVLVRAFGWRRPRPPRPPGAGPLLRALLRWGSRELLSLWLSLESLFYLFFLYKRWKLQAQVANPPRMPEGRPIEVLHRTLAATNDIQAGGKFTHPRPRSMQRSPTGLSPAPSAHDLQGLLRSHNESNVEQLLREWSKAEDIAEGMDDAEAGGRMSRVGSLSAQEREDLEKIYDDAEMLALKHAEVSGWFLQAHSSERWPASRVCEIHRGNVAEWMAWAFFHCDPAGLPESRRLELEQLIDATADWADLEFAPGYNPAVRAMRLTMDPIPAQHRPLIYYIVTAWAFPVVTDHYLLSRGFRQYRSGTLSYWYRPGLHQPRLRQGHPIVFCHGIGVNLLPYVPLINAILDQSGGRGFFLVSLPHISTRIKEDVPSSAEVVACLSDMLASWGEPRAHFVGHSFGSLLLAWMVRTRPDLVSMTTFIDPVCFLLVKPDVCYNFMYRRPATPTQLLIHYFLARELYIAHSLSRNFFWFQNLLWPEELSMPALVVLGGQDSIVPAHSIRRYLAAFKQRLRVDTVKVLWFPEMGHGEINFGPVGVAACNRIVQAMLRMEEKAGKLASAALRCTEPQPWRG